MQEALRCAQRALEAGEVPVGAVVVCEKHEGQTTMRRPEPDSLAIWLEKYRLGGLWMDGQLGGTRW